MIETQNRSHSTQFLSQLIMSFLERQIAPQTILDVFLAQLRDEPFACDEISLTTCNALLEILESLDHSADKKQILLFLSQHPKIKTGLSLRAALAGVEGLLSDPILHDRQSLLAVEHYAASLMNHFHHRADLRLTNEQAIRLYQVLHQKHNESLLRQSPLLLNLSHELEVYEGVVKPDATVTPEGHLSQILKLPEHTLAQKGLFHFGLTYEGAFLKWRLEKVSILLEALETETASDFRTSFLVDWFYDSALKMSLFDEKMKHLFQWSLDHLLKSGPHVGAVYKGLLRSLQRDQAQIVAKSASPEKDFERCVRLVTSIYRHFMQHYSSPLIIQELGSWVQTLPHQSHQYQLFNYQNFLWIQVLSQKEWNASLTHSPIWMSLLAEQLLPILVQIAPSYWLEKNLFPYFVRIQELMNHPEQKVEKQQIDFLTFVIRKLREMSPFFSRLPELLFALKALGACDPQEQKLTELFESRFQLKLRHPTLSPADQAFWEQLLARERFLQEPGGPQIQTCLHLLLKAATESKNQKRLGTDSAR